MCVRVFIFITSDESYRLILDNNYNVLALSLSIEYTVQCKKMNRKPNKFDSRYYSRLNKKILERNRVSSTIVS